MRTGTQVSKHQLFSTFGQVAERFFMRDSIPTFEQPSQLLIRAPALLSERAASRANDPGGHQEIFICEAILKSQPEQRWVDVSN